MYHGIIADINPNMARARCVIRPLEENQVARLRLRWRYICAAAAEPLRRLPAHAPAISTVIDHPAYKTGTVKTGGR